MYIPLKPLFSRHKGIGVQFTDEPTGNLDGESEALVASLLDRINKELNKSIVLVTHNPRLAARSQVFYHLSDKGVLDEPLRNDGNRNEFYHEIVRRM